MRAAPAQGHPPAIDPPGSDGMDAPMSEQREIRRGWATIVAAGAGVGVGLTGLPFYTFGVFIKPLSEAFGWGRSEIAIGMMFLSAGSVIAAPVVGAAIDRIGARLLSLLSLGGLALGFGALAASGPSLTSYYGAWLLLAALGCATTPVTWTRVINLSFDRQRGLALGLTLLGTGVASLFGPPLVQMLIASYGWQGGYLGMGLFVLLVILPIVALGLKEPTKRSGPVPAAGAGMAPREALASRRFWLIGGGIFLIILGQASATVHLVPLLGDRGVDAATAARIAGLLGVSVVVGRIGVGMLVDRFHAPKVARVFLALPAAALALLIWSDDVAAAYVAAMLLGLAAGAEVDLLAYLVSRYFGVRAYGTIYGFQLSIFGIGAGLGPPLVGEVYDRTGSYDLALWLGIAAFLAGAALIGFLGRYPTWRPSI